MYMTLVARPAEVDWSEAVSDRTYDPRDNR
jgi:hypothetical protein